MEEQEKDELDMGGGDEEEVIEEGKKATIDEVMNDMDTSCREETKELYESEGLGDALGDGGVPESLQNWLEESKEKILGPSGHREKAWKRLWGQVTRYVIAFVDDDDDDYVD